MFCPNCSEPVSDELKFCPRCGIALDALKKLVASKGIPDENLFADADNKMSARRKGIRQGAMMIFFGLIFGLIFQMLHESMGLSDVFAKIITALFVVGGLFRTIYAAIFEEAKPKLKANDIVVKDITAGKRPELSVSKEQNVLPSNLSVTADEHTFLDERNLNNADYRTVTENTTKLLKNEKSKDFKSSDHI